MNTATAKKVLIHHIEINRFNREQEVPQVATNFIGGAGIGKTSLVYQAAKELGGLKVFRLNVGECTDAAELLGVPYAEFYVPSIGKWVHENQIHGHPNYTEKRTAYAKPEWWPNTEEECILLIDDSWRSGISVQQALMTLVEARTLYNEKLPEKCTIVMTNNPTDGDVSYHVAQLDVAQMSRCSHFEVNFSVEEWVEWAKGAKVIEAGYNFVQTYPEMIEKEIPRNVERFFRLIANLEAKSDAAMINNLGQGCFYTGDGKISSFPTHYISFAQNQLTNIPSGKDLFEMKESLLIPKIKTACTDESRSQAIMAIMADRILEYLKVEAGTDSAHFKKNTEKHIPRLTWLLETQDFFSADLIQNLVLKLVNINDTFVTRKLTEKFSQKHK